jgi:hypothetical protein
MTWRLIRPIWRLADVNATQRLVLLALASFTDQRGDNAYPSQSTLARMCCCTARTIRRALSELIAMRIIEPHGKGKGGTIRYSVNVNVLPSADSHVRQNRTPMSYNPSKRKPSESYPSNLKDSKRDSYFEFGSDSDPGRRETIHEQAMRLDRARRRQT